MVSMKNTLSLLAALFSISLVATGCGSNGSSTGTGLPGTPGAPGFNGGVSTPLPGGGLQIAFSGNNIYNSGVRITGNTASFQSTSYFPPYGAGNLILGGTAMPVGQPGTITGKSRFYPNSSISLVTTPVSQYDYSHSNVSGVVILDPQFVQANFGATMPQAIGLALDVYMSGAGIYGGNVFIETNRDQYGASHGAVLQF